MINEKDRSRATTHMIRQAKKRGQIITTLLKEKLVRTPIPAHEKLWMGTTYFLITLVLISDLLLKKKGSYWTAKSSLSLRELVHGWEHKAWLQHPVATAKPNDLHQRKTTALASGIWIISLPFRAVWASSNKYLPLCLSVADTLATLTNKLC